MGLTWNPEDLLGRKIPLAAWVALGIVGIAAALLWWERIHRPIPRVPAEQSLAWPEVEEAPLTGPDHDPLPPGAIVRLGRERLRQGGGSALLAFSPDGNILASVEQPLLDWPGKYVIHLWQVATGKEIRRLESPPLQFIWNILFSPEGDRLSILGGNVRSIGGKELGQWIFSVRDVATGKQVHSLEGPWDPQATPVVVVSPNGKMLAWANRSTSTIHLCDASTGKPAPPLAGHEFEQPLGFTADGRALICVCYEIKAVSVWDVTTAARIQELSLSTRGKITFSADGKELLVWPSDGPIRCWDLSAGREVRQLDNPLPGRTVTATLSPDGRTAAAGYSDGTIRWWDMATGEQSQEIHAHLKHVGALTFSRDGKILASQQAWDDGAVHLWDVATGKKLNPREGHQARVTSVSIAPDGGIVATVGDDHTLRLWNAATGEELRRVRTIGAAVAFSPDGMALAMSGDGESDERPGTVWLLHPATGQKLRRLAGVHIFPFRTLAFSPDGSRLFGGGQDTCLWDVATGRVLCESVSWGSELAPAAFSADGTILAVAGPQLVKLLNPDGGQFLRFFEPGDRFVRYGRGFSCLAFSPDGKLLAAADARMGIRPPLDEKIRLFDVATGKERLVQGHRGAITSVQFSPNGKTLVSGGEDRTVRLWDVASGRELHRFEGHRDTVTCVTFAPGGRTAISGSGDSTALVWDVAPFCH